MLLEDYFTFLAPDDIRIKGSRIGIESVLYEYIYQKRTAEEIAQLFSSLRLEQIYATLLFYLHNQEKLEAYVKDWLDRSQRAVEEQRKNPSPGVQRLMAIKRQLYENEMTQGEIASKNTF